MFTIDIYDNQELYTSFHAQKLCFNLKEDEKT